MNKEECTKCGKIKNISKFFFRKESNTYRNECKECLSKKTKLFKNKYPWRKHFYSARRRCNNPEASDYKWYGKKGISFYLTIEDVEFIWFRDKAYLMEQPSIDRKDNNGDYKLGNCRFIEMRYNVNKNRKKVPILQYNLDGNFIKKWPSISQASKVLSISATSIESNLNGAYRMAGGFLWKRKEQNKIIKKIDRIRPRKICNNKSIFQFDKNSNLIKEYFSAKEASLQTGIEYTTICSCAKNKPHCLTAGGFIWKYKEK
jgi:hypothetical protein